MEGRARFLFMHDGQRFRGFRFNSLMARKRVCVCRFCYGSCRSDSLTCMYLGQSRTLVSVYASSLGPGGLGRTACNSTWTVLRMSIFNAEATSPRGGRVAKLVLERHEATHT